MVEAAKIVEEVRPDFIDINFGCPVKRVAQKGAGAGMLKDIPLMVEMTRQIVQAVKIPVTAKTRLGWDCEHIIIEDIAERLQDVGIQALAIHGRTRSQMYSGEADWEPIARVKNNPRIKIPILGNGDITSPEKAKEAFESTLGAGYQEGRYAVDTCLFAERMEVRGGETIQHRCRTVDYCTGRKQPHFSQEHQSRKIACFRYRIPELMLVSLSETKS